MTTHNLALYRILIKVGASETEAEEAATLDVSTLATKADLVAALAELKAELIKWNLGAMGAMTTLYLAIVAALKFIK
jgi:hypothetical protein